MPSIIKEPKIFVLMDIGKPLLYIVTSQNENLNFIFDKGDTKLTGTMGSEMLQQFAKLRKSSFDKKRKRINEQISKAVEAYNQWTLVLVEVLKSLIKTCAQCIR